MICLKSQKSNLEALQMTVAPQRTSQGPQAPTALILISPKPEVICRSPEWCGRDWEGHHPSPTTPTIHHSSDLSALCCLLPLGQKLGKRERIETMEDAAAFGQELTVTPALTKMAALSSQSHHLLLAGQAHLGLAHKPFISLCGCVHCRVRALPTHLCWCL